MIVIVGMLMLFPEWLVFGQFTLTDPRLRWQTLETEHFRIIFHEGLEGTAQEAAQYAEAAYDFWTKELGYAPDFKTSIVLADNTDFDGGSASPAAGIIVINTSAARSFNEWLNSRDASKLETVVYHEYGHVADLSEVGGLSAFLRALFGNTVLPTATKPGTFSEGIPIYEDFRRTGNERAGDPRDAMYFREMSRQKRFPRLDELLFFGHYNARNWPSSYMITHDLGPWLVRYMGETYGPDKVAKLNDTLARDSLALSGFLGSVLQTSFGLPAFFLNSGHFPRDLQKTLGVTPQEFYEGFKQWLDEMFKGKIEAIEREGVTQSQKISPLKYWNNKPAWSPDGQWIAYFHTDPARGSQLRLMRPDAKEDHAIAHVEHGLSFFRPHFWSPVPAWSPDSKKLIYSTIDIVDHFYQFGSIYLYELSTRQTIRLLGGERAWRPYRPIFTPDGRRILFANYGWGDKSPDLYQIDLSTGKVSLLKDFSNDMLLDSFSISLDGSQLALSIWRRGGFQDIYTMPASGGELTPITQDKAEDADPAWSPDGQYIVFSSDRDGVNNLYAYNISDKAFFKITNVIRGAFHPSIEGRQLAFVSYSTDGYEIHTMGFDQSNWKPLPPPQHETIPAWPGYPKKQYPTKPYNASETLSPKGWTPILSPQRLGFSLRGQDALFQQFYSFEGGYNFKERKPFYSLSYSTNDLLPPLALSLSLSDSGRGSRQELRGSLPLINTLAMRQELSFGISQATFRELSHLFSLGWSLSHLARADLLQNRLRLSLNGELIHLPERNRFVKQLTLEARDTLRLPMEAEQTLAFRVAVGWSEREKAFSLGGARGRFLLRGYKTEAFRGSQIVSASAEYRFPLLSIWRSLGLQPAILREVHAHAFAEVGAAGDALSFSNLKASIGMELRLWASFWGLGPNFRFGIAQGLDRPLRFYFDIGPATAF